MTRAGIKPTEYSIMSTAVTVKSNPRPASRKVKVGLVLFSVLLTCLLLEGAARVWVFSRWPAGLPYMLTHHTARRGRFTGSAEYGYTLAPDFREPKESFTHNHLGFRGREITVEKPPDVFRIVLMGASTIYGIYVGDEETSASQLERRFNELQGSKKVEVINAGVPGWVSLETLRSLTGRVLSLHPDVIVVADGRNEVFPQLFNNYRDDYSHFRRAGYDFRNSNYQYKRLFRVSYLLMVLMTRGSGHLGFSNREENPSYAVIDYTNAPTDDDILRNAAQPARLNAFRQNLEQVIRLCRENNVQPVLSTIPFFRESYVSNVIQADTRTIPVIAKQADTNNELIRSISLEFKAPLVDPASSLTREDLLVDDCHFNKKGEQAYADLMFKAIAPLAAEKN